MMRHGIHSRNNVSNLPLDAAARSHKRFSQPVNNVVLDQRMPQDSCQDTDVGINPDGTAHQIPSELDVANELFVWFDDYLGSNTSMLDILETDLIESSWHRRKGEDSDFSRITHHN